HCRVGTLGSSSFSLLRHLFQFHALLLSLLMPRAPSSTLFPYTTLFRSSLTARRRSATSSSLRAMMRVRMVGGCSALLMTRIMARSEEHTSELQSRFDLVCRLLLEKKKHRARRASAQPPQSSVE